MVYDTVLDYRIKSDNDTVIFGCYPKIFIEGDFYEKNKTWDFACNFYAF